MTRGHAIPLVTERGLSRRAVLDKLADRFPQIERGTVSVVVARDVDPLEDSEHAELGAVLGEAAATVDAAADMVETWKRRKGDRRRED